MDQWKFGTEEFPPLLIPMKNDYDRALMAMDSFMEVLKGFDRWKR